MRDCFCDQLICSRIAVAAKLTPSSQGSEGEMKDVEAGSRNDLLMGLAVFPPASRKPGQVARPAFPSDEPPRIVNAFV